MNCNKQQIFQNFLAGKCHQKSWLHLPFVRCICPTNSALLKAKHRCTFIMDDDGHTAYLLNSAPDGSVDDLIEVICQEAQPVSDTLNRPQVERTWGVAYRYVSSSLCTVLWTRDQSGSHRYLTVRKRSILKCVSTVICMWYFINTRKLIYNTVHLEVIDINKTVQEHKLYSTKKQ